MTPSKTSVSLCLCVKPLPLRAYSGLMRLLVFAGLAALCALLFVARPALAQDVTLEEYTERLRAASQRLRTDLEGAETLAEVKRELAEIETVLLPDGEWVTIFPLLAEITDPRAALARLDAAQLQLRLSKRDNLAERSALLEKVLARPEFRTGESLLERLARWFDEWWERLFGGREPNAASAEATQQVWRVIDWVLLGAGALALIGVLGFWISRLVRSFVGDAALRRAQGAPGDDPQTAAEARSLAAEQARAGSYRAAVRSLYLSALLALEESRLLVNDRSLTNQELLARAGNGAANGSTDGGSLREELAPVVGTFDDVWYGVHEPDAETFAKYSDRVDSLNRRIKTTREVKP